MKECKWDKNKHNNKSCPFHSGEKNKAFNLLGVKNYYTEKYNAPDYGDLVRYCSDLQSGGN